MFGFGNGGFLGAAGGASTSFLDSSMQQSLQGGGFTNSGGGFSGVLSSLTAGVTSSAQQGVMPGSERAGKLTPQQVAGQMSMGGPMSVLPMLGNSFLPKLIFPIAGLFSLIDGIKSFAAMKRDVGSRHGGRFDPIAFEQGLGYNQTMQRHDAINTSITYQY